MRIFNALRVGRRVHVQNAMTSKIVKRSDGARTIFKISGRIRSGDLEELRGQMGGHTGGIVLDLEEVTLVDVEVVRFLNQIESSGARLMNCPPYIREWMNAQPRENEREE